MVTPLALDGSSHRRVRDAAHQRYLDALRRDLQVIFVLVSEGCDLFVGLCERDHGLQVHDVAVETGHLDLFANEEPRDVVHLLVNGVFNFLHQLQCQGVLSLQYCLLADQVGQIHYLVLPLPVVRVVFDLEVLMSALV